MPKSIAVAAAMVALMATAPAAMATHVSCGDTITADTTLDSDLANCPGDGVVIGADNITLDLNGHQIDGTGSNEGVDNGSGFQGVTIKRGSIQQFSAGVNLLMATGNLVSRLQVSDVATGISVGQSSENVVERNAIVGRGGTTGILVAGNSDRNVIDRNTTSDPGFGRGIGLGGAVGNHPDDNLVSRNVIAGAGIGIGVTSGSATHLERNSVSDARTIGIAARVFNPTDPVLERNEVVSSTVGIQVEAVNALLLQNDVSNSSNTGIDVVSSGAEILKNVSNSNGGDGIRLTLFGAVASTVAKNQADDNSLLGIAAFGNFTDGGGNKASGNGNPLQCVGVVCK
jgi:hypothetical protein